MTTRMQYQGGYDGAMKAAGAVVHAYRAFGSYQGEWLAKVTWKDKTGWVRGYYGSCSHCDAFEAEFGWDWEEQADAKKRLAAFGRKYLKEIQSFEEAMKKAKENGEWDVDAEDMITFLKEHEHG